MRSLLHIGQNGRSGPNAQRSVEKTAQRENASAREYALLPLMHHTAREMPRTPKNAMTSNVHGHSGVRGHQTIGANSAAEVD